MVHLAEGAAWVIFVVIIFAIIGVVATIRWIVGLVTAGERAVEGGVKSVEDKLTGHGE
ncbi:MAG TPA: hypothetical protein VMA98_10100 [Candidatus Acidoferrales bacterium]|nr:hypothetical protein [Candidatus Acidoferrales bacterium]